MHDNSMVVKVKHTRPTALPTLPL